MVRQAERIFHSIHRSKYPINIPYSPGNTWNIEKTISKFLISGDNHFTYKHVVCTKKEEKQRNIVLLIDKSHSVLIYLKLIILTSILFSLTMNTKDIAIIGFDSHPETIKGFIDKQMTTQEIINKLVNIRSGGKTDIFAALQAAKKELSQQISRKKTVVIISDLLATSGLDFLPVLKQMEDIRIILTPRRQILQLTAPIIGQLRRLSNIKLCLMTPEEQSIPAMLEKILYD